MSISRRNFIRGMAGSSVAASVLATFPPSIKRALAIPANNRTGTIKDVEYIVVLMQENRAFDHYFGTMKGVRGFGDRFTIPAPNGRSVWAQHDSDGKEIMPYHLDSAQGNAQRVTGTPHGWRDGQQAWDNGRMSEWARYKKTQSMGYYREAEIPFQFAMANAFTLCDAYHCSMHTGTNSNRLFMWTGTNGPTTTNEAVVNNTLVRMGPSNQGFTWKTYPERLEEAGISWKLYQNMPENYGDNPLVGFRQYRKANEDSGKPVSSSRNVVSPPYHPDDNEGNPLYKGIANTMPDGGMLQQFRDDVLNNELAQVTWIVAPKEYSEHPTESCPAQGGWYTQEVLDALTANPDIWSKTVLLVNFDENDGFFDHVPSPSAPSYNPDGSFAGKTTLSEKEVSYEYYTHSQPADADPQPAPDKKVYGPGIRVPMYVISPWSRGGWVNSEVFDHTSVIKFMEARFGVMEPNISPFRRAVCGDLTSAFNFKTPNDEPLPFLDGRYTKAEADSLRVAQEALAQIPRPKDNVLPVQEVGVRPSRALDYHLHVSARCGAVEGVTLLFANTGKRAAVFHVYDKLNMYRAPRRYMVEPGKTLEDSWDVVKDRLGRYDLWVLGPNGFHRHFKGNVSTLTLQKALPEIRVCYDVTHGNVSVELMNGGTEACTFTVEANFYREDGPWNVTVAPRVMQSLQWDLQQSGHWYDFTVRCSTDPSYERRFAGRVETGKHGVSDPALALQDF